MIVIVISRSIFNSFVNTLNANFGHLQPRILMNLFKSYCCILYGSHLCKYITKAFDKCCNAWDKAIHNLLCY